MRDWFRVFAREASEFLGSAWMFSVAILIILVWAFSGHWFNYSDTWQLIINTGTTIVTFLMVFLIQNTQNRDSKAMQLKLDELIRAVGGARNRLVDLEKLSDDELSKLKQEFERISKKAEQATELLEDLHLYFYTLRDIISWAIAQGLQSYCSSPLNYNPKLHLGCELVPLDLYVLHTQPLLNPVFRRAVQFLEPTRHDPVLQRFPNAHELK